MKHCNNLCDLYSLPILSAYAGVLLLLIHRSRFVVLHDLQYCWNQSLSLGFHVKVNLALLLRVVAPSGTAGADQSSCTVAHHTCDGSRARLSMREKENFIFADFSEAEV